MITAFLISFHLIPFLIVKGLQKRNIIKGDQQTSYIAGTSLFFLMTGISHFLVTDKMALLLPPTFPNPILTVQITGILEIAAAISIWLKSYRLRTGQCLIAMMIAFLPFNIWASCNHIPFGSHELGPVYLWVRVPLQFFFIWWISKGTSAHPCCLSSFLPKPSTVKP